MYNENPKQRETRLKIEQLVQDYVDAGEPEEGQPEDLLVLQVSVAVYGRSVQSPGNGGYYMHIYDPATPPHAEAGLLDFVSAIVADGGD